MASKGFYAWLAAGSPYTLIPPAGALARTLRGHGFTVWHYPDYAHQVAVPPEDHTPYSETGWPGPNARWNARALDVPPKADTPAARRELAMLARRIIADKNAGRQGTEWIKYLNWTDESGVCRQERWTPGHETRLSTDRGHIHISGRSDADANLTWTARAAAYDPYGVAVTITDDDVRRIAQGVWELFRAPLGPDGTAYNMQDHVTKTEHNVATVSRKLTALAAQAKRIADALEASGGDPAAGVSLAVLQRELAELRAAVSGDTMVVVAAFGGAAAVDALAARSDESE